MARRNRWSRRGVLKPQSSEARPPRDGGRQRLRWTLLDADTLGMEASAALRSSELRARVLGIQLTPAWALAGLVAISALARSLVALTRATPTYFPDEYLYSAMSRSIAETGRPLVRGSNAHLPSLLEPFMTAPAWLIHDTATAFMTAQLVSALAMSLAAIPVYALCRTLDLRYAVALGAAALTVCVPGMMYATTLIAEPFAYPLALAALAAGTVSLGRGGRRAQVAFVALAAAAAFARVQLLVIPLAYIAATLVVGVRSRSLRTVARGQVWVLVALTAPLVALPLVPRVLGIYGHAEAVGTAHTHLGESLARNGFVFLYACGWVIVPGAVIGLAAALVRPRSQTELAFAALSGTFAVGVLLQASMWGETDKPQERYFIYALPLVATLFALTIDRGWPWKRGHALLAAVMVVIAAAIPLSGYAASTVKEHSPTLWGVASIEGHLGTATGALAVTGVVTVLSIASLGLPLLTAQRAALVGLGAACAGCLALATMATSLDVRLSGIARSATFPESRTWVDDARVGDVTFLRDVGSRGEAFSQLVWNRSIRRVLLLPGAPRLDVVDERRMTVAADGTLLDGRQPVIGPVLVDQYASVLQLRRADLIASSTTDDLLRPHGRAQLVLYATGFFRGGVLGQSGHIVLWPSQSGGPLRGRLSFQVTAPTSYDKPVTLRLGRGSQATSVVVAPGKSQTVAVDVCRSGPWATQFTADRVTWIGGQALSLQTTRPVWHPSDRICAGR